MKKNVVFLVIDSLYYDRIEFDKNNPSMPFLVSKKNESLWCTNMYSEASFTEAALVSLLCGEDTLCSGGYLKRLNGKKTIMNVFEENGYHTFFNGYQPGMYPKNSYPGVIEKYYNVFYSVKSMWPYRLKFFCDLNKKKKLSKCQIELCMDILKVNMQEELDFLNKILRNDNEIEFLSFDGKIKNIKKDISLIKNEIKKFKIEKEKYLLNLFELEEKHVLFTINDYRVPRGNDFTFRKLVKKKFIFTFLKIYFKNIFYNLKNNCIPLKSISKNNNLRVYIKSIFDRSLFSKINPKIEKLKDAKSMRSHIDHFENCYKNWDKKDPFFAYIHVDDVHYPSIFYSHDSSNIDVLKSEFNNINRYLKKINRNYYGSITYDLSLLYADYMIEKIYNFLVNNKLLDNTYFVITADHGNSYSFAPSHYPDVNNEFRENYHIPFVILGGKIKNKIYDGYYNSKDIPSTVISLCNLNIPSHYTGKSITSYSGNKFILMQNILGGCPDYHNRIITMGCRDDKFSVTLEFDINNSIESFSIKSIFDQKNDPFEYVNIKDKIDLELVKYHILFIKEKYKFLLNDIKINDFLKKGSAK